MKIAVSACLLGQNCKYNGSNNASAAVAEYVKGHDVLPVCPESTVFPTPRPRIERRGDRVVNEFGVDVTDACAEGVKRCMEQVRAFGADLVILQSRSPSCGVHQIYDGTFSGVKIPGKGVFAQALAEQGIRTLDVEDL